MIQKTPQIKTMDKEAFVWLFRMPCIFRYTVPIVVTLSGTVRILMTARLTDSLMTEQQTRRQRASRSGRLVVGHLIIYIRFSPSLSLFHPSPNHAFSHQQHINTSGCRD